MELVGVGVATQQAHCKYANVNLWYIGRLHQWILKDWWKHNYGVQENFLPRVMQGFEEEYLRNSTQANVDCLLELAKACDFPVP